VEVFYFVDVVALLDGLLNVYIGFMDQFTQHGLLKISYHGGLSTFVLDLREFIEDLILTHFVLLVHHLDLVCDSSCLMAVVGLDDFLLEHLSVHVIKGLLD